MLPQTRPALDTAADAIAQEWLSGYRVAIKALSESRQSLYAEITAMSTDPQLISVALPKNRQEETKRTIGETQQLLERRALHLLADDEGMFLSESSTPMKSPYLTRRSPEEISSVGIETPLAGETP